MLVYPAVEPFDPEQWNKLKLSIYDPSGTLNEQDIEEAVEFEQEGFNPQIDEIVKNAGNIWECTWYMNASGNYSEEFIVKLNSEVAWSFRIAI